MNTAYVYLQLYRLFDRITPVSVDCGMLCTKACCQGTDSGMYLFPGEQKVYELLNPDWIRLESSDFTYQHEGKTHRVPLAVCNGTCDRYQRPLACRIFPLTPVLDENGALEIIIDPRAKSVCPLSKGLRIEEYDPAFVKNIARTFRLLLQNKQFYSFLRAYSIYINDFKKFF